MYRTHAAGLLSTPTLTILRAYLLLKTIPYFVLNSRVMEYLKLDNLIVTGHISVEPVTKIPGDPVVYIIMGPTGAGKSTFIEALAGDSQNLAISSNQLAGFTQHVTAYKLVNISRQSTARGIYLVDTPGFSDSKISEIEVVDMLRDWLEKNCSAMSFTILFLTPITVTRLPGSRRRTIKMIEESLGGKTFSVTVTTTMWDTLHSERTRSRAEKTSEQLKAEVFKGFFRSEPDLKRFMGTWTSALQVMDSAVWDLNKPFSRSINSSTHLYCDLHERIEGALQKKIIIESELAHSDAQTNKNLKEILERDQKENNETLAKFISQLVKFGEPPADFLEAAQALCKTIAANITPIDNQMRDIFRQWAEEPDIHSGAGSDPELKLPVSSSERETTITKEAASPNLVHHRPSRKLDLKGLFHQVVDHSKAHRPKWFKRGE
ncbi:hypothetical protein BJ165DRAFT_1540581 [Panaeolus papilionaceus]|nr:hypothetical protein BJ165DRAFT_1540581 [Panaeolus papilionaceus]